MFVNNLRPIWQINDSLLHVLHEAPPTPPPPCKPHVWLWHVAYCSLRNEMEQNETKWNETKCFVVWHSPCTNYEKVGQIVQ